MRNDSDTPGHDAPVVDRETGIATTGHSWDGIRELNRPLPRWWLILFYLCQVWALVYIVLYPSVPLLHGATRGLLDWSSRGEVADEMSAADLGRAATLEALRTASLQEIVADETLRNAAFRGGASAFKVNCVQCHGSDAAGSVGYANLNDDDWLWGGTLDDIYATIRHGVRFAGDDETHMSEMPAFGREGILTTDEVDAVARYVAALGDGTAGPDAPGAELYAANCAVCHGPGGEGEQALGAPRLNDAVWLYGGDLKAIRAQIRQPRHGVMPAWGHRLDDTVVKELTVYVHGLGGGRQEQ